VVLVIAFVACTTAGAAQARRVTWPGPVKAWLCIHSHEAAWTNNHVTWDGRWSDYEGGLQMDSGFQRTYGLDFMRRHHGLGAHAWTPREQMIAANRARVGVDWRGSTWPGPRGFSPWPTSARICGLLR
jgi:hypothetical protein